MEASESEKDEIAMAIQSRIEAPLQWDSPPFAKIIDLKEIHYDEVLRLIKHHFFKEEPMSKASILLDDVESVKAYLDLIRVWMKDSTSIVAISSISGRVIGTAIARINSSSYRTNTYSRVQIFNGETLEKLMHLKSSLVKQADPYKSLNHETIFRIYILCVHPSYQRRGLGMALLEACIQMTASLKLPAIVGAFTSGCSQRLAENAGFKVLSEIRYSRWIVNDRVVFDNPGIGNYSTAFMGMILRERESLEERKRARQSLYKKRILQKYK